ncbi:Ribbon-helix-helix protein, copG family [Geoglobus ahangari]|uniref:Ribbon-helix-helix protein, copG family n=1 Tax=Geoglobus ahangari TaxID=113653 RepID=A0A0F7IDZ7_9EURY|nr:hypothetical protein [Geoglobus ahangari]AKG90892.1 Ribbon-helix-helix protein, copG family [Geoglobus ahangari]
MATTVRVSRSTSENLETLKKQLGMRSVEEVIDFLIKEYRKKRVMNALGLDEISEFMEEDRLEDRG